MCPMSKYFQFWTIFVCGDVDLEAPAEVSRIKALSRGKTSEVHNNPWTWLSSLLSDLKTHNNDIPQQQTLKPFI